jgi:hypothetical protein
LSEIRDPHTGQRWLLVRDETHPGGPGRLVLAGAAWKSADGATRRASDRLWEAGPLPVIRAGDRLIVEEHTAAVDAVLEARAMNAAAAGAVFAARLTIGGKVVRAVALGPGRAVLQAQALQPETGARP